ncbi:50S ribosomal protein L29 [Candidatus Microgenomates bacterium]|nr:50S ribosomal protein L29 [Candidatus Microgenomates bacterium]
MREKLKELRQKDMAELKTLLVQKRKKIIEKRFDLKLKKTKNVHEGKSIRKEIARILTIIKEKESVREEKK